MTPKAPLQGKLGYRPEIDGLRAIAVLLVLVFHFEVIGIGQAGFVGVDIFFVISGFLITTVILSQLDAGSFRLATFYANRVRRLAPALTTVIAGTVAYGAFTLFPDQLTELMRQAALSQMYVVNLYYWRSIGYFGLGASDVHLLHIWSLCVEEQFYILYPAALLIVYRYARRYLWVAIGLSLAASFALNLLFVSSKPEATFYLLPTRAWELLAGALVAGVVRHYRIDPRLRELLGLLGLILIAVTLATYRKEMAFPGGFAALPVAAAVCLLLVAGSGPTLTSRLLSAAPVAYVGRISYPLYLVHWPVHVFARQSLGDDYTLALRWLMFGATVVAAALIYHLVEEPIRTRKALPRNGPMLAAYAAGVVAVLGGFLVVQATQGFPGRFPADVQRMASYRNDTSPPLVECQYQGVALRSDEPTCRIGAAAAPVTWLVYGDSHAWAAHGVFDAWLRERGQAGVILYRNSCPPSLGLHVLGDRGMCLDFNTAMLSLLQSQPQIVNVFLVSSWLQPWEARLSPSADKTLDRAESIAAFSHSFSELLQRLSESGKRVHVWEPVPGAKDNVPLATARAMMKGHTLDLSTSRQDYERVFDYFFALLRQSEKLIHARFSPAEALCDHATCAAMIDGRPVYADNSHISRSLSAFWTHALQRTVDPR